jgi:tRNA (guanine-N7-)-methyltransferase
MLNSFGRRKGRRLRVSKQGLVDTLLPKISIALPESGGLNPVDIFPNAKDYWLEIGFGGGEHLAHVAGLYPEVGIIGCEPYVNGIAGLLAHIESSGRDNIRVFTDDARLLIAKLPDACLSRVYILYPDPWPKARHNKRRLVNTALLDMLSRVMKKGAELRLATDSADYATWMLERLQPHPAFRWLATKPDDWLNPPSDWISTRYEQKALAGRPTYLNFTRL